MIVTRFFRAVVLLAALGLPLGAHASGAGTAIEIPDLIGTLFAILALIAFVLAYVFVIAEEFTHLRKSKAMVVMAGLIWVLVGIEFLRAGIPDVTALLKEEDRGIRRVVPVSAGCDDLCEHAAGTGGLQRAS